MIPYRCQKMLGFTRVMVILCFLVFLKVYFFDGVLSQISSTQPTDSEMLPLCNPSMLQ